MLDAAGEQALGLEGHRGAGAVLAGGAHPQEPLGGGVDAGDGQAALVVDLGLVYDIWVEEVWVNYISNALKYGGQPGRVELGAEQVGTHSAMFWVRDYGAGIPREEQVRIFAPFTRLGRSGVKGYGLGLSIVRRIIETLGGEVGVDSLPGEGSTFWFTLPAWAPDDEI